MMTAKKSVFRLVLVFAAAFALAATVATTAFAATPLNNSNCSLGEDEFVYDGTAPALTVLYKANEDSDPVVLSEGIDYDLTYGGGSAPVDAGDNLLASIEGKGSYSGVVDLYYIIKPAEMTSATTALGATTATFDAAVKAPSVMRIVDGAKVAVPSGNYDIAWYSDSACTASATPKDVGTYYAKVTFKNNFSGTVSPLKLTISPVKMTSSNTTLSTTSFTFSNTVKAPTAKRLLNGEKLTIASTNYTIAWYSDSTCKTSATPKKAGTYYAKVTFKNNYSGSGVVKVTIAKKALTTSAVILGASTYTYDGKIHAPAVKYKWSNGTITLARGTSYSVVYYTDEKCTTKTSASKNGASEAGKAPKKGGTYYMKITGMGSYKGSIVKSFKIYYKVTYKLDGGTNSAANKAKFINTFKLYEPTKKSYTFMGWYTTSSFKSGTKVTSAKTGANRTLYAKWTYGHKPGSYVVGKDIPAGTYYFKSLKSSDPAYVLVYKDEAAKKAGSSSGFGAFDSMYYAALSNGQVVTTVNCCFQLSSKYSHTLRTSLTEADCGLYKVGTDLAAGTYRFSKIDKTGWSLQVFTSAKYAGSNPDKTKAKYFQTKSASVTLTAGTYVKIEHATLTK